MQMDDMTKTYVETEAKASYMESWKSPIQIAKEAIRWLKQGLGSIYSVVEDCLWTLADLSQRVYDLGAPKSTNG